MHAATDISVVFQFATIAIFTGNEEAGEKDMAFLSGRVAIVVGAGRGIGAATARILAEAGAAVTLAARTTAQIEAVAKQIYRDGGKAEAVSTDVIDVKQVQHMVKRTVDHFGRVDFLINCAAVVGPVGQATWEIDPESWRRTIQINLFGIILTCRAVLPYMLEQGYGRLLNVSAPPAEVPVERLSAYAAAKAGVNHLTRVLAVELRGTGVTANIVYPGPVETEIGKEFRIGMFGENRPRVAPGRHPSKPARLLLWLCSPATAWMNGQIVSLDDWHVQRQLAGFLRLRAPWPTPRRLPRFSLPGSN